jgi:hypothetical protein
MNAALTDEGFNGKYLHRATSQIFALRIVSVIDPEFGKPYQLRNESHYRECNEKEFKEQFVKL